MDTFGCLYINWTFFLLQPIPYVGSFPGGNMTPGRQIIIQGMVPQCSEG